MLHACGGVGYKKELGKSVAQKCFRIFFADLRTRSEIFGNTKKRLNMSRLPSENSQSQSLGFKIKLSTKRYILDCWSSVVLCCAVRKNREGRFFYDFLSSCSFNV